MTDDRRGPRRWSRRALLQCAIGAPLLVRGIDAHQRAQENTRQASHSLPTISEARGFVTSVDGADVSKVELTRDWADGICRSKVTNHGRGAVAISEVVLFDLTLDFPASTPIYGEGFQMLSQTGGTLAEPKDLGSYTDAKHYRMPMPDGAAQFYGAMTIAGSGRQRHWLAAFTSCRRFSGLFRLRPPSSLQIVVDTEGLTLAPGASWELEELLVGPGETRDGLLASAGARIAKNHPPLKKLLPPTGVAASFTDDDLLVGRIEQPRRTVLCFFNWFDRAVTAGTSIGRAVRVTDFWTGESLGRRPAGSSIEMQDMPPHSARLLICDHV